MQTGLAFELLRKRLFGLPPGEVAEEGRVAALLAACWHEFVGADSERMHAGKLGRTEDVCWEPPVLSFRIERHGAMGVGSTRAEIQHWRFDLDRKIAGCERSRRYRQALPRVESVRIEPIAKELRESVIAGRTDQRLKWQGDETVRILMAKIFPYDSGYMQTVTGRRKRLRAALETLLADAGWREIRRDVYSKAGFGGTGIGTSGSGDDHRANHRWWEAGTRSPYAGRHPASHSGQFWRRHFARLRLIAERAGIRTLVPDNEGEFAYLREAVDVLLVGASDELAAKTRHAALLARRLVQGTCEFRASHNLLLSGPA